MEKEKKAELDSSLILKSILDNLNNIKKLEQDNLRLKEILLKSRGTINESLKKKIQSLLLVIKKKEAEFEEYKKKLAQDYKKLALNFNRLLLKEKKKNIALKALVPEIKKLRLENENLRKKQAELKFLLKKEFEKKLSEISNEFRINKAKHKTILKEYEDHKLKLKARLEKQKSKNKELIEKYNSIASRLKNAELENRRLREIIKNLENKINELTKKDNKEKLNKKISEVKAVFEARLLALSKEFLEKEIGYKARIKSLNSELKKYFSELEKTKAKYYKREEELKNKIKSLNRLFNE